MNFKPIVTAVLLSCGAVLAAGCAQTGHERTPGAMIDDGAISTKVKTALIAEKDVNARDIEVQTFNGVVQLSGFVDSQWQIDRAGKIAAGIDGVRQVKNNLIHKPAG